MTKRTLTFLLKRPPRMFAWIPLAVCACAFIIVYSFIVALDPVLAQSGDPPAPETTDEPERDDEGFFGGILGGSDDGGGLFTGLMLDGFEAILDFLYEETIGDLLGKVGGALQAQLLGLPVPRGEVVEMYDSMADAMRPAILVGILITALLMMVRTANHDVAYAGFSALPKLLGIGIALAFLPQFMQILAFMTDDVSGVFLPSGSQAGEAGVELFKTAAVNVGGSGAVNLLLAVAFVIVGFMVVLVSILKNIMFYLLFIAGPFALAASVIPQTAGLAASWFRGVMACAAIPILWSVELGVGSVIVASPEALFGGMTGVLGSWGDGVFTSAGAIVILWIMYKTPFKVLDWAFEGYGSRHGPWRNAAKSLAVGTALHGIKTAMSGAAGGGAGAAAAQASTVANPREGFASRSSASRSSNGGARAALGGGVRGGGSASWRSNGRVLNSAAVGAIEPGVSRDASSQDFRMHGGEKSGGQTALPRGKEQLALPTPSPAIEKFLRKDGVPPGLEKPRYDGKRNIKRDKEK